MRSRIIFDEGLGYWINGAALAAAARMISSGECVHAGVHFLSDAVEPIAFIGELRKAGVQQTETFELLDE